MSCIPNTSEMYQNFIVVNPNCNQDNSNTFEKHLVAFQDNENILHLIYHHTTNAGGGCSPSCVKREPEASLNESELKWAKFPLLCNTIDKGFEGGKRERLGEKPLPPPPPPPPPVDRTSLCSLQIMSCSNQKNSYTIP